MNNQIEPDQLGRRGEFAKFLVHSDREGAFRTHISLAKEQLKDEKMPSVEIINPHDSEKPYKLPLPLVEGIAIMMFGGPRAFGETPIDLSLNMRSLTDLRDRTDRTRLLGCLEKAMAACQGMKRDQPHMLDYDQVKTLVSTLAGIYIRTFNLFNTENPFVVNLIGRGVPLSPPQAVFSFCEKFIPKIEDNSQKDTIVSIKEIAESSANILGSIKEILFEPQTLAILAKTGLIPQKVLSTLPFNVNTLVELQNMGLLNMTASEFAEEQFIIPDETEDPEKFIDQTVTKLQDTLSIAELIEAGKSSEVSATDLVFAIGALRERLRQLSLKYKKSGAFDRKKGEAVDQYLQIINEIVLLGLPNPYDQNPFDYIDDLVGEYNKALDAGKTPEKKIIPGVIEPFTLRINPSASEAIKADKEEAIEIRANLAEIAFPGAVVYFRDEEGKLAMRIANLVKETPIETTIITALRNIDEARAAVDLVNGRFITQEGISTLLTRLEQIIALGEKKVVPFKPVQPGTFQDVMGQVIAQMENMGLFTYFNDDPVLGLFYYLEASAKLALDKINERGKDKHLEPLVHTGDIAEPIRRAQFAYKQGDTSQYRQDPEKAFGTYYFNFRSRRSTFSADLLFHRSATTLGESTPLQALCSHSIRAILGPNRAKVVGISGASGAGKTESTYRTLDETVILARETGVDFDVVPVPVNAEQITPSGYRGTNVGDIVIGRVLQTVRRVLKLPHEGAAIQLVESGEVRVPLVLDEALNDLIKSDENKDGSSADYKQAKAISLLTLTDPSAKAIIEGDIPTPMGRVLLALSSYYISVFATGSLSEFTKKQKVFSPDKNPERITKAALKAANLPLDLLNRMGRLIDFGYITVPQMMASLDRDNGPIDRFRTEAKEYARVVHGIKIDDVEFTPASSRNLLSRYARDRHEGQYRAFLELVGILSEKAQWQLSSALNTNGGETNEIIEISKGRRVWRIPDEILLQAIEDTKAQWEESNIKW